MNTIAIFIRYYTVGSLKTYHTNDEKIRAQMRIETGNVIAHWASYKTLQLSRNAVRWNSSLTLAGNNKLTNKIHSKKNDIINLHHMGFHEWNSVLEGKRRRSAVNMPDNLFSFTVNYFKWTLAPGSLTTISTKLCVGKKTAK
jgi:hypothetical protein